MALLVLALMAWPYHPKPRPLFPPDIVGALKLGEQLPVGIVYQGHDASFKVLVGVDDAESPAPVLTADVLELKPELTRVRYQNGEAVHPWEAHSTDGDFTATAHSEAGLRPSAETP